MLRRFLTLAIGLAAVSAAAVAPAGAQDSGAHMVSVKDINPKHLITVQIDPVAQAKYMAQGVGAVAPTKPTVLPPVDGNAQQAALHGFGVGTARKALPHYDWFWNQVPTGLQDGQGRFQTALAALNGGPNGARVAAPRLQAMQSLATTWGIQILKDTVGTQVSPALVLAVMSVESGGDAAALSPAGAEGLMQLIPATAKRFGVKDPLNGAQSIKGAVAYLDWLMGTFNRDPVMVLAAYNAGEGAVTADSGVPPYPETRDYVPKVLAAWNVARNLCLTPPQLVSDPCVFRELSADKGAIHGGQKLESGGIKVQTVSN